MGGSPLLTAKELFEIVHREIHYEQTLISNRMTWYVISQSFLMTAFAASGAKEHDFRWLATGFIPILGIITSTITWLALYRAKDNLNKLTEFSADVLRDEGLQGIPADRMHGPPLEKYVAYSNS